MTSKFTIALFALVFSVAPALADCATDLTKIDEAMKSVTLEETAATKAKESLEKAKAAQTANDEELCMASTKEVLTLLGM